MEWNNIQCLPDKIEKPSNQNSSRNGKGIAKGEVDHKGPSEKKALKKGSTYSSDLKPNGSDVCPLTNGEKTIKRAQPKSDSLVKVPVSLGCQKTVVRFKLRRLESKTVAS
ncbi:hypothetical protein XELAEV_18020082mg [Xenopus laevis]|uniref:Uncharacterized protein n=1 Tax=Xenopus laevis TaxID=8355 RepID=A0A974D923_XENLA|nr:hypothetical protein XELAEV_18020082mg [Xenopus laevis]